MDQVNRILTCAYTKKSLKCPELVFKHWSEPNNQVFTFFPKFYKCNCYFQMVKNCLLNLVMIRVSGITYVCLVVENMVYYWKDNQYFQMSNNHIFRVQYPALANFVFISWFECFMDKWLLSSHKPFASHLVFSPNCPIRLGKNSTDVRILNLCIDLWEDDESLTNWEMTRYKPWEIQIKNIKDYQYLHKIMIDSFKISLDHFTEENVEKSIFDDSNPFFVDTPYKLLEYALNRSDGDDLLNWIKSIWPIEMSSARAREMIKIYS